MEYKYITENNLYQKQTYMYSEYGGASFLKSYVESRQQYLNVNNEIEKAKYIIEYSEIAMDSSNVIQDLLYIRKALKTGKWDLKVRELINAYVKSFEVRKRIYDNYDSNWKPDEDAGFENYAMYLLFAECLGIIYQYTGSLKYFSCLLKVDDVLLSIQDKLDVELKKLLCQGIRRELTFLSNYSKNMG